MDESLKNCLLSGLAGALIAQVLTILWSEWNRRREYRALLNGIVSECDYNLSIVDEILEGVVERKGSLNNGSTVATSKGRSRPPGKA